MKNVNLDTIIDTLWYKTWQQSGYNHTHVKQKLLKKTKKSLQKFLVPTRKPKVIYINTSLNVGKSNKKLSWNIVAIRAGRKMVGGFYGMLLLTAKHTRSLV